MIRQNHTDMSRSRRKFDLSTKSPDGRDLHASSPCLIFPLTSIMSPISLCAAYLKPSTLVCTQCDNIGYCSETCQITDKSSHQIVCHAFQNFSDNQRPDPRSKRGILLPSNAANPQSVWLDTKKNQHLGRRALWSRTIRRERPAV